MRILITGSPSWDDEQWVHDALVEYHDCPEPVLVVVDVENGPENFAIGIAQSYNWPIEPYRMETKTFGEKAYLVKLGEILQTEPDICLTFIKDETPEDLSFARLAEKCGVMVRRFEKSDV